MSEESEVEVPTVPTPDAMVPLPTKKRGRPASPFTFPKPSEAAKEFMAKSPMYRLLVKALLLSPSSLDAVNILSIISAMARQSAGNKAARIELMVPDEFVKNLKGDPRLRDTYVFVRIQNTESQWKEEPDPEMHLEEPVPIETVGYSELVEDEVFS